MEYTSVFEGRSIICIPIQGLYKLVINKPTHYLLGYGHFILIHISSNRILSLLVSCGSTFIIIEKNEQRSIVFVSHLFEHPRAKYHWNSKISFLKMDTQQECRKKIIEIFNEKPRRLQKTIAKLAGVNQKTVSKITLK